MRENEWQLGWKGWDRRPHKSARVTTCLVTYARQEAALAAYSRLERFLHDRFNVTLLHDKSNETNGTEPYIIEARTKRKRQVLATTYDLGGGLAIRALNPRSLAIVTSYLKSERSIVVGQLPHTEARFSLNHGITVRITTGDVEGDGRNPSLFPSTFGELAVRHKVIGKASLVYVNSGMGDFAPTIERSEIRRAYRSKGFGRRFLGVIEECIGSYGFDRIWATDAVSTGSTDFWEHMGYEAIDEEGEELLKSLIQ